MGLGGSFHNPFEKKTRTFCKGECEKYANRICKLNRSV